MKSFVGIVGTTCVGKSKVAVELAKKLQTAVISADSMQIYKGMNIGTAKITKEEMQGVRHFMLDIVEPCEDFSSFLYAEQVAKIIEEMPTIPVVAGGTGFYIDSLLYPPQFGTGSKQRRFELQELLERDGIDALCDILRDLDKDSFENIDRRNPVRVIRAIEIAEGGEKRFGDGKKREPRFDCRLFILQRDRQKLYEEIDERVDKMVADGLLDEVKRLLSKYGKCDTSAFAAIGYKEMIDYFEGKCGFDEAVAAIKLNTRHYAKRQISYFKRMNVFEYIDVDGKDSREIAEEIYKNITEK